VGLPSATEDALDLAAEIGVAGRVDDVDARAGLLEKPVDEGGLPMVDMGDDGDIAKLHGIRNVQRGPEGPAVHMTPI
jgi:hypothetical protein